MHNQVVNTPSEAPHNAAPTDETFLETALRAEGYFTKCFVTRLDGDPCDGLLISLDAKNWDYAISQLVNDDGPTRVYHLHVGKAGYKAFVFTNREVETKKDSGFSLGPRFTIPYVAGDENDAVALYTHLRMGAALSPSARYIQHGDTMSILRHDGQQFAVMETESPEPEVIGEEESDTELATKIIRSTLDQIASAIAQVAPKR